MALACAVEVLAGVARRPFDLGGEEEVAPDPRAEGLSGPWGVLSVLQVDHSLRLVHVYKGYTKSFHWVPRTDSGFRGE